MGWQELAAVPAVIRFNPVVYHGLELTDAAKSVSKTYVKDQKEPLIPVSPATCLAEGTELRSASGSKPWLNPSVPFRKTP